jgi:uncharacterized repeat protein (TIGR03943 family)
MTFFDANTFTQYNTNMRQLVFDKIQNTQLVVFNRFDDTMDKMALHKIVRGITRQADIVYERVDGRADFDDIEDPLPFDINAPVIDIKDEDFAIFYRDMSEEFPKYAGKKVRFKGIIALDPSLPREHFAIGRHIMTCCEADIAYRGVVAKGTKGLKLKTRDWVIVEGVLNEEYSALYQSEGPVLTVSSIERAEKPIQEVATF